MDSSTFDGMLIGFLCVLAFALAGLVHSFWLGSRKFRRLAIPIDGGVIFAGQPLLGSHKTLAGFVMMPPATALAFGLLGWAAPSVFIRAGWPSEFGALAILGLGGGLIYMLGELPNSFFKRRLGVPPGATPSGPRRWVFQALDQLDSIVAALVFISFQVPFGVVSWVTALMAGYLVHVLFNRLLVRFGVKQSGLCMPLEAADSLTGGKAAGLARLLQLQVPVPRGFALSSRAFDRQGALKKEVIVELRRCLRELGQEVIVRSSACGEDSGSASFAGILSSHRCSSRFEDVIAAIAQCRAGLSSDRAREYQRVRGSLGGLGVVIQNYIAPQVAGVAFTRSPIPLPFLKNPAESAEWMLIELVPGDNAKLVDGSVTPARLAYHPHDGVRHLDGELPVSEASLQSVFDLLQRIGADGPRDVEWVVDAAGKPWIVQARPITAGATGTPIVWTNANIAENYPSPAPTLQFSIVRTGYYHYFRKMALLIGMPSHRVAACESVLQSAVGLHGARLYFNLTHIYKLCCELPFAGAICTAFDQFMGVSADARSLVRVDEDRLRVFRALRIGVMSMLAWVMLPRRVARFERLADSYCRKNTGAGDLAAWPVADFLDIRFNHWWLISAGDLFTMLDSAIARHLLRKNGLGELESDLLAGIPNLVSSLPGKELWRLARRAREEGGNLDSPGMKQAIGAFVENYGFRCSEELMLTSPGLDEAEVRRMVHAYLASEVEDPVALEQRQRHVFERAWKRLDELGLVQRVLLRYFIGCTRKAVALRERARFQQARLYKRFGTHIREMGLLLVARGVLNLDEDLFFLTHDELLAVARGAAAPDVSARKADFKLQSARVPPGHFVLPEGETYSANETSPAVSDGSARTLTGSPASGGRVAGVALVTRRIREISGATCVVVTPQTDPGWAPYMPMIKGLVVERGGLLSHGAIIAREYGIPAVIGVTHATDIIPDGVPIDVDGHLGTVTTRTAPVVH